jgi:hypothetical protein
VNAVTNRGFRKAGYFSTNRATVRFYERQCLMELSMCIGGLNKIFLVSKSD